VDLISLGLTDLSTALRITAPADPRLRQKVEELVAQVNRIGKAQVYLPVYHAALYLTPQELVQMGVNYTSVAPPPPTVVLNAIRESAQRMREQAQQTAGV
jgi:2-keto-3-deoxy-L-rhamnonate aldolase RhmA